MITISPSKIETSAGSTDERRAKIRAHVQKIVAKLAAREPVGRRATFHAQALFA